MAKFNSRRLLLAVRFLVALTIGGLVAGRARAEGPVDFNQDVRALISNTCFRCHGPDEAERKGDLRLDTQEGATADLGGHAALIPGKPDESELIKRITSTDPPKLGRMGEIGKSVAVTFGPTTSVVCAVVSGCGAEAGWPTVSWAMSTVQEPVVRPMKAPTSR